MIEEMLLDVTSEDLDIETSGGRTTVLIPKNTSFPTKKELITKQLEIMSVRC